MNLLRTVLALSLALMATFSLSGSAWAGKVTSNPDGTKMIEGVVEQIIPIENSASLKVKNLGKILLIQNLTLFSERKLGFLHLSLESGKTVLIKVSSEFKVLDILM